MSLLNLTQKLSDPSFDAPLRPQHRPMKFFSTKIAFQSGGSRLPLLEDIQVIHEHNLLRNLLLQPRHIINSNRHARLG